MKTKDLENKENRELKKSIAYLQISTGIFHLSLVILYWILVVPISAILDYVAKALYIDLDISLIFTLLNLVVIFIMVINILNLILGVVNGFDYFTTKDLKLISKIVAILMLLIFPVGTVTGWIVLKNK